jgi:hypothetical protein
LFLSALLLIIAADTTLQKFESVVWSRRAQAGHV